MCAFHYWLALITKPFQPGGNNGFRRQLNCPARFATDSLIEMQRFTCAFSPTIGCHTPPPFHLEIFSVTVVVRRQRLDFEISKEISTEGKGNFGNERIRHVETSCRISLRDLFRGARDFWQIFCQASLSNDRSYKGAGSDATRI